jgi:uncharacterized Zn finger protein (UPF0148 family)
MLDIWNYVEGLDKFTCPICGQVITREEGELFSLFELRCVAHIKRFVVIRERINMDNKKLNTAIEEAKRFLDRAKELQTEQKKTTTYVGYDGKNHVSVPSCPKESGAVRRASMDLSRALSDLRRY